MVSRRCGIGASGSLASALAAPFILRSAFRPVKTPLSFSASELRLELSGAEKTTRGRPGKTLIGALKRLEEIWFPPSRFGPGHRRLRTVTGGRSPKHVSAFRPEDSSKVESGNPLILVRCSGRRSFDVPGIRAERSFGRRNDGLVPGTRIVRLPNATSPGAGDSPIPKRPAGAALRRGRRLTEQSY